MKPRIFVFSIGEATTDLCMWALERYGMEPILYQDNTSLQQKLARFYKEPGDSLMRIDADIIPNKNVMALAKYRFRKGDWWVQTTGFGWYQQRPITISVCKMTRQAADIASQHIDEAADQLRPETAMWRLPEFHNPRRCRVIDLFTGVHGYGQSEKDIERVRQMKTYRGQEQNYDWKMINKMHQAGKVA